MIRKTTSMELNKWTRMMWKDNSMIHICIWDNRYLGFKWLLMPMLQLVASIGMFQPISLTINQMIKTPELINLTCWKLSMIGSRLFTNISKTSNGQPISGLSNIFHHQVISNQLFLWSQTSLYFTHPSINLESTQPWAPKVTQLTWTGVDGAI